MGTEIELDAGFRPIYAMCVLIEERWELTGIMDGCVIYTPTMGARIWVRLDHLPVCIPKRCSWTGEPSTGATKNFGWQMFQPEVWWRHFPVTSSLLLWLLFRFNVATTIKELDRLHFVLSDDLRISPSERVKHLNHYLTIPGHKEIQMVSRS